MKITENLTYTDGACSGNPGPGGWGCVVRDVSGGVIELGGRLVRTTNNAMELTAAIEALSFLSRFDGPVVLRTDSKYVIQGIQGWVFRWRTNGWKTAEGKDVLNRELWQRLMELAEKRKASGIRWEYVPGHQGVPGNERADAIATGFAQGHAPSLFKGPASDYGVDLDAAVEPASGAGRSPSKKGSSSKKGHYLSLVGGVTLRHAQWASCEARVKGQSGARFKKVTSAEEEREVLRNWGVNPARVGDAES